MCLVGDSPTNCFKIAQTYLVPENTSSYLLYNTSSVGLCPPSARGRVFKGRPPKLFLACLV
jgi:hypothetical protein